MTSEPSDIPLLGSEHVTGLEGWLTSNGIARAYPDLVRHHVREGLLRLRPEALLSSIELLAGLRLDTLHSPEGVQLPCARFTLPMRLLVRAGASHAELEATLVISWRDITTTVVEHSKLSITSERGD